MRVDGQVIEMRVLSRSRFERMARKRSDAQEDDDFFLLAPLDRPRSHNPILREAALDQLCPPIPWLGNRRLSFTYP